MIQNGKLKNAGIFLILFIMILTLNMGSLKTGFVLISFAQETEQTGETVGIEETQETPATEEAVDTEETTISEETEEVNTSLMKR